MGKDLLRDHVKAAGRRVGVSVYPHRLRHTTATQLLNAGCRVTSIQKFLGHKELSTTLVYARVYDQTVAEDYYQAMERIEQRLDLVSVPENSGVPLETSERDQLLALVVQLAQPEMSTETRLEIAGKMRFLLAGRVPIPVEVPINEFGRKQWEIPPPSPVSLGQT